MPLALHTTWRLFVACCAFGLFPTLGACRIGGGDALVPPEGSADPVTGVDASTPLEPDAGDVVPPPTPPPPRPEQDGGMVDGSTLDAATPAEDGGCTADCGPGVIVPAGCNRAERAEHSYLFCSDAVRWDDARATCLGAGADLVVVDDEDENTFVAAGLSGVSWIGAHDRDTEGAFLWITPGQTGSGSRPLSFTRWALATPDNCLGGVIGQQDCARIAADGTWNDSDCAGGCTEGLFGFVCESY